MTAVHLYGGPMSGRTINVPGWPAVLTIPFGSQERARLWEVRRYSRSEAFYLRYMRTSVASGLDQLPYRYIHEDMIRYWEGQE